MVSNTSTATVQSPAKHEQASQEVQRLLTERSEKSTSSNTGHTANSGDNGYHKLFRQFIHGNRTYPSAKSAYCNGSNGFNKEIASNFLPIQTAWLLTQPNIRKRRTQKIR